MRYEQIYLLGCALMVLGYASTTDPARGFDGSERGRSVGVPDVVRCFERCDNLSVRKGGCDGCSDGLWERRPGAPTSATATEHGHLPDWHPVTPLPSESAPDESAILLCLQYVVALQQCFMALQGIKNEKEQLSMFHACLEGRYFSTEPSVCRRNTTPRVVPTR
jgi:hypothetical protein